MKQAHKRLMACSIAGVGVLLMAVIAWADMGKSGAPGSFRLESGIRNQGRHDPL